MLDLLEMMRRAHGGDAVKGLADSFGLSRDQAAKMMEAFMPAFAASMKRATEDPAAWQPFLAGLSGNAYVDFYRDATRAFSAEGMEQGRKLMQQMFPAPGLSDAIAAQVAAMSGGGPEAAMRMFPALAAMFMGGLASQMPHGPAREAMENFLDGFRRGRPEKSPLDPFAAFAPFAPIAEAWSNFFTAMTPQAAPKAAEPGETPEPEAPPEAAPEPEEEPAPAEPFRFLDEMMTVGKSMQDAQIAAMNDLFRQFQPKK